jgi:hypothetical protein
MYDIIENEHFISVTSRSASILRGPDEIEVP